MISLSHHSGTNRPRICHHGQTLVELAVAISVVALLFALISTVVVRLLQAEARTRDHPSQIYALSQLADQFRADVHRATELSLLDDSEGQAWRIESIDARTIEYAVASRQIRRTVLAGSDIRWRDAYRLPEHVLADFQLFRVQDQPFARIRLQYANESRTVLEVVAQVGRDQRFSRDTPP